jgi:hypothetical protein
MNNKIGMKIPNCLVGVHEPELSDRKSDYMSVWMYHWCWCPSQFPGENIYICTTRKHIHLYHTCSILGEQVVSFTFVYNFQKNGVLHSVKFGFNCGFKDRVPPGFSCLKHRNIFGKHETWCIPLMQWSTQLTIMTSDQCLEKCCVKGKTDDMVSQSRRKWGADVNFKMFWMAQMRYGHQKTRESSSNFQRKDRIYTDVQIYIRFLTKLTLSEALFS